MQPRPQPKAVPRKPSPGNPRPTHLPDSMRPINTKWTDRQANRPKRPLCKFDNPLPNDIRRPTPNTTLSKNYPTQLPGEKLPLTNCRKTTKLQQRPNQQRKFERSPTSSRSCTEHWETKYLHPAPNNVSRLHHTKLKTKSYPLHPHTVRPIHR